MSFIFVVFTMYDPVKLALHIRRTSSMDSLLRRT